MGCRPVEDVAGDGARGAVGAGVVVAADGESDGLAHQRGRTGEPGLAGFRGGDAVRRLRVGGGPARCAGCTGDGAGGVQGRVPGHACGGQGDAAHRVLGEDGEVERGDGPVVGVGGGGGGLALDGDGEFVVGGVTVADLLRGPNGLHRQGDRGPGHPVLGARRVEPVEQGGQRLPGEHLPDRELLLQGEALLLAQIVLVSQPGSAVKVSTKRETVSVSCAGRAERAAHRVRSAPWERAHE